MPKTKQGDDLVSMLAQDPDGTISMVKIPIKEAQALFVLNAAALLRRVGASWGAEPTSDRRMASAVMSLSSILDGIRNLKPDLYAKARARYTRVAGVLDGVAQAEHVQDEGDDLVN